MNALDYASFCRSAAISLMKEFDEKGIIATPVFGSYYNKNDSRVIAFLHPDDKFKREDELKYPYRDI
jgi:hypothetical protein